MDDDLDDLDLDSPDDNNYLYNDLKNGVNRDQNKTKSNDNNFDDLDLDSPEVTPFFNKIKNLDSSRIEAMPTCNKL
jgi:hypothetical protein